MPPPPPSRASILDISPGEKVVEVRRPRQHQDRATGLAQKRRWMVQTVVLECAGRRRGPDEMDDGDGSREGIATDGERETVLLHLWDEQMCLTSLFQKGDGLAVYWPWLVQSDPQDAAGGRIGLSQAPSLSSQASSRGQCFQAGARASAHVGLGFWCAHVSLCGPRRRRRSFILHVSRPTSTWFGSFN